MAMGKTNRMPRPSRKHLTVSGRLTTNKARPQCRPVISGAGHIHRFCRGTKPDADEGTEGSGGHDCRIPAEIRIDPKIECRKGSAVAARPVAVQDSYPKLRGCN